MSTEGAAAEQGDFPRLRNLPVAEREPFGAWLRSEGHTMPVCDATEPRDQWDWYYPIDLEAWRAGSVGDAS